MREGIAIGEIAPALGDAERDAPRVPVVGGGGRDLGDGVAVDQGALAQPGRRGSA